MYNNKIPRNVIEPRLPRLQTALTHRHIHQHTQIYLHNALQWPAVNVHVYIHVGTVLHVM